MTNNLADKLFHDAEALAILTSGGVYRQVKVYRRFDGEVHGLYAAKGSGYVRLHKSGGTSCPRINLHHLEIEEARLSSDKLGRFVYVLPPVNELKEGFDDNRNYY